MLSFVLCGCNQKTQTTGSTPEGVEAKAESENILHRLPTLHVEDTVKSGSNVYALMINREACDSLGIVTDEMGYRFADNLLKISVKNIPIFLFILSCW